MSRFVSAGTNDDQPERDDEWIKAQQEIEANRRRKLDEEEASRGNEGKSLYEVLQANKAAKQEAFEESAKFKNQFRSLDEDEVDFLDSVLESTRAQEAAVKKETDEQLEAFRLRREEAEKAERLEQGDGDDAKDGEQWKIGGKKRKRDKEVVKGFKLRRSSSTAAKDAASPGSPQSPADVGEPLGTTSAKAATIDSAPSNVAKAKEVVETSPVASPAKSTSASPPGIGLGLAAYSSDED